MNAQKLLISLALLFPLATQAQSISPAQLEQFKQLPRAQQEALASQYGVDLNNITGSQRASQRPEQVNVVEPVATITDEERDRAREQKEQEDKQTAKNGGLKPYGYDLFAGSPTTFAPVTEIPVPSDYTMGPGDVLRVQMWGNQNQNLELPVSRDGTISFPDSGPVTVAGLSFDEARQQIRKRVSEQYIGVDAAVTLGELRSMRVFVLGEARNPGSYSVSSLSTITNALYVSGGIKQNGSLRNVQHKRNGQLVGTLDLYDLLQKGDSSADNRLQPGDVIFIPPVGKRAGIEGEVYRPALYELKGDNTLAELVRMAGGLTTQAYPQRINIERTNEDFLRIIAEADYTGRQGQNARVQAGDRIRIPSISDITGQYVEIKGAATRAGKFAWMPGMRVSSILQSLDADLMPTADKRYAAIVRTDQQTDTIAVLNLRIRDAIQNAGSEHDLLLEEKDRILIFSDAGKVQSGEQGGNYTRENLFAPVLQRLKAQAQPGSPQQTIRISGPVRYPGEYPMPATRSLADAVFVAGGLKDSASLYQAEVARYTTDDSGIGQTNILNINLADAMAGNADLNLQSRDTILIKSIPDFATTRTVTLAGEVRYPGEYTFRDGETLKDVVQRAGGLTNNAFPTGSVFTRAKLRELEAQRLREAEERLQGDLLGVQLEGDGFGGQNAERVQQVQGLLEEVQSSRPLGRMVIDLAAILDNENYQAIRLQDGDRLTVPIIPQAVSVFGEVQFPTSHLHQAGLTVDDYLERSGGPTRQADESRVYVVKADGSVTLPQRSRWFGGRSQQLEPGDTIIMPIDVDRLNQLELWTNVSQIIYQMALGAAAVNSL
ncbi:SLBB domain-containing protein [Marinobacter halophilus]|uniref:Sugar transporter n=1 Tax=Marinobacter halophilus TaxID=1323740 RepID=A0A2T1KE05_9GAMM|nr:SLBB domain-containing protein [Marinobacter halophilus]PSF07772.1 sugar transporter [Marinobacter halophilus]GGC56926.1 sugar transporter [Marinobacter halophilus]